MVFFKADSSAADENKWGDAAVDRWIALGIFLLGAGVGALTTVALYAGQIRNLKGLPEAASPTIPQPNHQATHRTGANPPSQGGPR